MKVLVVGPSITKSKGGMATVIRDISESELLNKEHDINIFSSYIDGNVFKRIIYSIVSYTQYLKILKTVDIVHIHMASRGSTWRKNYYIKSAKTKRKKVLLHIHGASYKEFYEKECSIKKQKKIRNLLSMSDEVIVLSKEWKSFFTTLCDANKIKVLHNAVPTPKFKRSKYNDYNVLFLGRLGERKGTYDLLESIPMVIEKVPEVKFFLGGDGDVEICKKICINKGIIDNVNFLGWVSAEDKEKYLELCSTYILPSYNEGMPMSVLEAMSWGCGVITTPVGGIPQVIANENNGVMVNPGDIDYIAETLIDLLTNKDKKEAFGKNARKTVEDNFSIDKWYESLLKIYEN